MRLALSPTRTGGVVRSVLLALTALVVIGLLGWVVAKRYKPAWFDRETVNQAELEALQSAKLSAPPTAAGQIGWPQWFGPNRDGRAPAGPLRTDWEADPPKPVWTVPCGGGYSSFAVVGGRVYTQDRQDGRERRALPGRGDRQELWETGWHGGLRRTWSTAPDRGRLRPSTRTAVRRRGGREVPLPRIPPAAPGQKPTVAGNTTCTGEFGATSPDLGVRQLATDRRRPGDRPGGRREGSVVAFDKATGETRWGAGSDPNGYSSPVAATAAGVRQVIAVTGRVDPRRPAGRR